MTPKYKLSEVYPNSPLVEVVCEIRFPGELAIECRRDEFYEKIRERYPRILIPQGGDRTAPYRFENEEKTSEINLGLNRFSLHSKRYEGHRPFITEFVELSEMLYKTYNIKRLHRVGWRYVNVIPYTRENGIVPLNRFITARVAFPKGISDEFENLSLMLISKVSKGSITTRIESIIRADNQQEALLLDFDFGLTEDLSFSKIRAHVNKVHKETRALFENLITDEYREYLRGEAI